MREVTQLCNAILQHQRQLNRPLESILRPGLRLDQVQAMTSHLPFQLPQTAIQLFCWKDGTKRGVASFDKMSFFPGYYLLPLYEAVYNYHLKADTIPDRWDISWFPLFSASDGECYAIECNKNCCDDGRVIQHTYIGDQSVAYNSLKSMLSVILECFDSGVFFVSEDGQLDGEMPQGGPGATQI